MLPRKRHFENFAVFGYTRASFVLRCFLKNVLSITTFLLFIQ